MSDPAKKLYLKLGVEGLSELTSEEKTAAMLAFLKKEISSTGKILDIACGYGRLSIPLKQAGYSVYGIDLSPNLVDAAKENALNSCVDIGFRLGDMRDLPYEDNFFDTVICMWTSFCHMLNKKDQVKAIREMVRVVRKGGIVIVDMPDPEKNIEGGCFIGDSKHLFKNQIKDCDVLLFLHTKQSLSDLIEEAFAKHDNDHDVIIKYENIGKSRRLVLILVK
ncbi:class I SAM-dependent methyltransferase [Candidatus Dependentiae bacterium]|nr:class I SAM-dependent methyltransferase [Candidatus Dependentiae bacterium]